MNSISHLRANQINLVKGAHGQILPADEDSAEKYSKWRVGEVRKCEIKKARNLYFHNKYFKMLSLAYDNQEIFDNDKFFLDYVKKGIGWYDTYIIPDTGEVIERIKSISFDNCNQHDFEVIYQKTLTFLIERYGFDESFVKELMSYA